MKIIKNVKKMQGYVFAAKKVGKKIGFVPTMGALHEGHLSLIRRARKENDLVVVSIFVNPTQFGPKEDFKKYPRPLDKDVRLAKSAGAEVIFIPALRKCIRQDIRPMWKWESWLRDSVERRVPDIFAG